MRWISCLHHPFYFALISSNWLIDWLIYVFTEFTELRAEFITMVRLDDCTRQSYNFVDNVSIIRYVLWFTIALSISYSTLVYWLWIHLYIDLSYHFRWNPRKLQFQFNLHGNLSRISQFLFNMSTVHWKKQFSKRLHWSNLIQKINVNISIIEHRFFDVTVVVPSLHIYCQSITK